MYKEVISVMDKIYYSDQNEFTDKVNKYLNIADLDFSFSVKSGMPEMTTTKSCSDIYYYMSKHV